MDTNCFLLTCKDLYLKGIHPFDSDKMNTAAYKRIVQLGKNKIEEQGLQTFLEYLMENHYRVNFWTAKLGLEFGNPSKDEILKISGKDTVIDHCLETVVRHLSFETTWEQEQSGKDWIEKIKSRYNKI